MRTLDANYHAPIDVWVGKDSLPYWYDGKLTRDPIRFLMRAACHLDMILADDLCIPEEFRDDIWWDWRVGTARASTMLTTCALSILTEKEKQNV